MLRKLTPEQVQTLRRAIIFAIILVLMDLCLIGWLLYFNVIHLPPNFPPLAPWQANEIPTKTAIENPR